jgi:uncharacterized protein YqeY
MALKEQINDDLKAALLGGDRFRSDVLRNLKAAILNEEVAKGARDEGLADADIEQVIVKEVKKRNESASLFRGAGREELADTELKEAEVLSAYLPKQLSEQEVKTVVEKQASDLGISDPSGMGQLIGAVKKELGSSADGATIAKVVKDFLK